MQRSRSEQISSARSAIVLLLLLAVFVAGAYLLDLGETFRIWWVNAAWSLASLAAGLRSLLTARRCSGRDARAFALIGSGSLSFCVGMLVWSYYELLAGISTPFPALSDVFFLAAAPLYALGLVLYRPAAFRVHTSFTQLGNLGLVGAALLIVVPVQLHDAIAASERDLLYVSTALAWAGLYLVPAVFGLAMLTVYDWGHRLTVLGPLVFAFLAHAVVDVLYARQLLFEVFETGGGLDVLWLVAFAAEYWAAERQDVIAREAQPTLAPSQRAESLEALLPAALVGLILLTLVLGQASPDPVLGFTSLLGATVFAASLGLRDVWIRRADARLRAAEASARRVAAGSERRLQALFEQSADAIFILDAHGRVQAANPAAGTLVALDLESLRGRDIGALLGIEGSMLADGGRALGEVAYHEVMLTPATGFALPAEISVVTLSASGEPRVSSLVVRDLRERRLAEARRLHGQRLEAVGQLTGGIAHDFNNLLTVIIGNADLLAEQPDADPQARELARTTRVAAERGADLVRRLLAFARRQPLVPVSVDVGALLEDMTDLLRRALGEQVSVRTQREAGLWHAEVDPVQLESALLNLCLNARDAMPGGGSLVLRLANATRHDDGPCSDAAASEEERIEGDYVQISVSDSGTGMAPEVVARAFEPFFTTKDVGEGSGLGLSMVYGFVRQSGGHVRIDSRVGAGTCVHLFLPAAMTPANAPPTASPAPLSTR